MDYREQIQTLVVEPGVTTLGWSSFQGCSALHQVYLPETLVSLEYGALAFCTALESIYLPTSLQVVGIAAFIGCSGLVHLTIPPNTTTIEDSAFINCANLRSLSLPQTVHYVGSAAFKNCSALSTIYYQGNSNNRYSMAINGSYNSRFTTATWQYNSYTPESPPQWPETPQIPDWAISYTDFVANGIMPDISVDNYDHATPRDMVAFSLYNMVGNGVILEQHPFLDVTNYDHAISWCDANHIMNGTGDALFSPDTPVTREQMAVILWQSAQVLGKDSQSEGDFLPQFHDQASVSPWASDAMSWAVDKGLLHGNENYLYPGNSITRAEVAVMLYNFNEMM